MIFAVFIRIFHIKCLLKPKKNRTTDFQYLFLVKCNKKNNVRWTVIANFRAFMKIVRRVKTMQTQTFQLSRNTNRKTLEYSTTLSECRFKYVADVSVFHCCSKRNYNRGKKNNRTKRVPFSRWVQTALNVGKSSKLSKTKSNGFVGNRVVRD